MRFRWPPIAATRGAMTRPRLSGPGFPKNRERGYRQLLHLMWLLRGGDALAGVADTLSPQCVVDDRDEVGERFAGAGACGRDVAFDQLAVFMASVWCRWNRRRSPNVLSPRLSRNTFAHSASSVPSATRSSMHPPGSKFRLSWMSGVGRIDFAGDVLGADPIIASGKPLVLGDEFLTEGEFVYQRLIDPAALTRASIALHRSISASNGSVSSSSMPSASILS